jgi:hypothetical protein
MKKNAPAWASSKLAKPFRQKPVYYYNYACKTLQEGIEKSVIFRSLRVIVFLGEICIIKLKILRAAPKNHPAAQTPDRGISEIEIRFLLT